MASPTAFQTRPQQPTAVTADELRHLIEDVVGRIIEQCAEFQQQHMERQQLQLQPPPALRRSSASTHRPSARPPVAPLALGASMELTDSFAFYCSKNAELHYDDDTMDEVNAEADSGTKRGRARPSCTPPLAPIHFVYHATASRAAGSSPSAEVQSQGSEDGLVAGGSEEDDIHGHPPRQEASDAPSVAAKSSRRTLSFPNPQLKAAHCSPHASSHAPLPFRPSSCLSFMCC